MTQKIFLKELEKKLQVLVEQERNEIINEYKDIIEEKVKHGETEEKAVADFGNIDELTKEILSAYKINYEYDKKEETDFSKTTKRIGEDLDSLVKKGAKKLSEITKSTVDEFKKNDQELTLELVFELVLKGVLTLFLLAILVAPFVALRHLGVGILDLLFFPLNHIMSFMYQLLLIILYFVCCALVVIGIYRPYFKVRSQGGQQPNKEEPIKPEESPKKKQKKSEIKEESKEELAESRKEELKIVKPDTSVSHTLGVIVSTLLKIFIFFCMLPFTFAYLCIFIALLVVLFLWIKGLFVGWLFLCLLGVCIFIDHFIRVVYRTIFHPKKIHFFPFIIGIVFAVVGGLFFVDRVMQVDYIDALPPNHYALENNEYKVKLDHSLELYGIRNYTVVTDSSQLEGTAKVVVTSYKDFVTPGIQEYASTCSNDSKLKCHVVSLYTNRTIHFWSKEGKEYFDLILDQLKDNKAYHMDLFFEPEVKVYVHPKDTGKVRLH